MIKLTIEDLQEIADFKVIERPLIQKPLIAESDVVTIDNNLSTYVTGTQKRELTVNLGYLDREGYEILRGFRDRQYENLKYPKASITADIDIAPDGQIIESDITKSFNLTTNDNPLGVKSVELVKIGDNEDYIFEDNGRFYVHKATAKIASYNGETITTDYISTTGGLTTGATVYYVLATPLEYEITKNTLVELRYARTYVGQTNVWTESDSYNLPVRLDYSYQKDGAYLPVQITDSTYANLTDTLDAPLDITKLGGDTFQQTYSGKNLFNKDVASNNTRLTATGGTISETGYYTSAYIAINASTSYTYSRASGGLEYSSICFYDGSKTFIADTRIVPIMGNASTSKTFTTPASATYIRFADNAAIINTVQLESGNQATSYEPYVGGVPAPSPDYPQTVQTVTGEQKIEVHNKNLFDKNNANTLNAYFDSSTTTITANPNNRTISIPVLPNKTYTLQSIAKTYGRTIGFTKVLPTIGTQVSDIVVMASGANKYVITTKSDTKYIVFRAFNGYSDTGAFEDTLNSIQLEFGNQATTYEPYKAQEYELNLGNIELCKIGTYQDYIYPSGGKWYLHKEIKKIVLDGSEDWQYYSQVSGLLYLTTVIDYLQEIGLVCLSKYYQGQPYVAGTANVSNKRISFRSSGSKVLYIRDSTYNNASDFKTWLSTHNNPVYYVLATPTDTEITNEDLILQLEDLWSTYGFSEYTTIATSAGDTGNAKPVLEATQGDITGKGTDYTLEDTKKMPMEYKVYGQAIQNGTPSTSTPVPIETVKGNNSITFTGPSGRKEYSIVGKMTLADQRIIDNCGTAEQVQVVFRESKQI